MIKEELCHQVTEVRRKSDRIVVVMMVYGKQGTRVVSCYAPQACCGEEEKDRFSDDVTQELAVKTKRIPIVALRL